MLLEILKIHPPEVTEEQAALRDSLVVEELERSIQKMRELLEGGE